MKRLLAVIFLLSLIVPVVAQEPVPSGREFYRQQFADWGGIVFRCLHDENRDFEKRICRAVTAEARFLAAAGKVPFKAAKNQNYFSAALESSRMGNGLILEAIVRTSSETGFTGVTIRLAAGNHYNDAISTLAKPGSAEANPRGGTLVLWEHTGAASGNIGSDLEQAVTNGFETLLKDFFGLFLEHWQPPTR